MKPNFWQRMFALATLCFVLSSTLFAQNQNPPASSRTDKAPTLAHTAPPKKPSRSLDCNDDQTPPQIQCPGTLCLPDARAAYLTSYNGEPWGVSNNIDAMNAVFGPGNWDALFFEGTDAAWLFSSNYKVVFLDGSYYGAEALAYFLQNNQYLIETWVAQGGGLFLNCAPNSGANTLNAGFGGVTFQNFVYISYVVSPQPTHPIFNGPFAPANGGFQGNDYLHAHIQGPSGTPLLTDGNGALVGLSVKEIGLGKVYFGTMTTPNYHTPSINSQNMRQNILADLNAQCKNLVTLAADEGSCSTKVGDGSLDASATDDCALVSIIHDFANTTDKTTLLGAEFPAGQTTVTWTATDATGNSSTCYTVVWVKETIAPEITCPDNFTVHADPGVCGAVVSYPVNATDNCGAVEITALPSLGTALPNGYSEVYAIATDASGNQNYCSFYVEVIPNPEICNGLDDDCDGWVDENIEAPTTFYLDADYDGYGNPNVSYTGYECPAPWGYVLNALDCDDANYYLNPGMYEYCDGIDNNCNGQIDEGVVPTWYADADRDGFGDPAISVTACEPTSGFVSNNWDCDDTNAYINPNAREDCTNDTDENCDGILGENDFTIEETHADVFCGSNPDGNISISMTPAQNYIVTLWSTGACCTSSLSGLDAGTYRVTVSNECGTTKTKEIIILPAAEPALTLTMSGTTSLCGGEANGSISVVAENGCGGYSYLWWNGETNSSVSGLPGGAYNVVVTDACGCTKSADFIINQAYPLSLNFVNIIPLLDGTYFIQVSPYGGTAPYQFRWLTAPNGPGAWSSSNGFIGITPGDQLFEVVDAAGCSAQAGLNLRPGSLENTPVESRQSSRELPQALQVKLFPNPNTGVFNVGFSSSSTESEILLCITDFSGRLLQTIKGEQGNPVQTINASELPAGAYLLQVVADGKVLSAEKFVKE